MARDRLTFRERDLRAAIKVVQKAGLRIARVEVGADGRIVIVPADGEPPPAAEPEANPWDEVLTPSC